LSNSVGLVILRIPNQQAFVVKGPGYSLGLRCPAVVR